MEQYLDDGLIALLPIYTATDRAIVVTLNGEHNEGRSVPWLIEKLAMHYTLDINELRRLYGEILSIKKHVTIPINGDLVLIPVKTWVAEAPGETTIGYCSLLHIDEILNYDGPGPWLSIVRYSNGFDLYTLNTTETVRGKVRQAEQVRHHYSKRRCQGPLHAGMSLQDIRFPNCDCVLLDLFRAILKINEQ